MSNPHKIGYLNGKEKRWDLVVIDEAHDLICNNQKQTEYIIQIRLIKHMMNI